jgi:hypothetical protein
MGEWKLSRFAWIAIGSIDSGLREMETHYNSRKQYCRNQSESESPQLPEWIKTLDFYLSYYREQEAEK